MNVRVFNIRLDSEYLIIDQNRINDFLNTIRLKKSSTQFIEGKQHMWSVLLYYEPVEDPNQLDLVESIKTELNAAEAECADKLKVWRQTVAENRGVSSYMILNNKTVNELVKLKPSNKAELLEVFGIGERKAAVYGEDILTVLSGMEYD